jgi:hypothetical protein
MNLVTAHFENATPILADLDLALLLAARDRMNGTDTAAASALEVARTSGDPVAIQAAETRVAQDKAEGLKDFMGVLAVGGKIKAFRKLAAIAGASADDLLEAETNPAKMTELYRAAAVRPFLETLRESLVFFSALVPTRPGTPDSSNTEEATSEEAKAEPENTPSGVS